MDRRKFLGTLAAAAGGAHLSAQEPLAPPKPALVRTPLVVMAPRADGLEAVWAVSRLSKGRIEWETTDGRTGVASSDAFGMVPQDTEVLRVRLSGFAPGGKGRLRSITAAVDDGETVTSDWKPFRTLDPQASTTHFVMWNDTHIHNDTIRQLHERTPTADFLLWNGDTCNDWTKRELLIPTLLHPGECDITAGRLLFLTWGNHDVRGMYAFELPSMIATPTGRPFHAFRSGPVAAICLHTGEDKPDDHPSFRGRVAFDTLRAEQAAWLAEVIQRPEFRDAPYRIVFCHIPLRWTAEKEPNYAAGGYDAFSSRSRAAWHPHLVTWKCQIILSGHTHCAAWIPATAEFPYGQLVGGGPKPAQATWLDGKADAKELRLTLTNLAGEKVQEVALPPVA